MHQGYIILALATIRIIIIIYIILFFGCSCMIIFPYFHIFPFFSLNVYYVGSGDILSSIFD